MKIVGIKKVDFKGQQGEYHGYRYFTTDSAEGVNGVVTDSFFLSETAYAKLNRKINLGDEVLPVYPKESKTVRTVVFLK